jgi:hypothetical protein
LLGLRHGLRTVDRGLPRAFSLGDAYRRRFLESHGTVLCKEIRGERRLPTPCIKVVSLAPVRYARMGGNDDGVTPSNERREAHVRLYNHFAEHNFHCARAVLQSLTRTIPITRELLDAVSLFMGGTLFEGQTCSALTAGIMAVGLKIGEIEDSPLRVLRMIATMAMGGDAFKDGMNKFNRAMNTGHTMARMFRAEFGSTQCRSVTGCDFSLLMGAGDYMEADSISRCRVIAARVAEMAEQTCAAG